MGKSRDFRDEFDEQLGAVERMSDAELESLLSGHSPELRGKTTSIESLEPGSGVRGTVIDFRAGELLIELDQKTHGVVPESEFEDDELPGIGETVSARFERYDASRGLAILAVREARREIFWDEARPGMIVEGLVTAVNKGGLTVDIKGIRAFLPVSQIEVGRVDDTSDYVGTRLRCEITSVDRAEENLVVSRRTILEREAEELKGRTLARLSEGEVLKGTVVRVNEHGAFVDLGGVEGLLHASRIKQRHQDLGEEISLRPGQEIEVKIARVDPERGRVSLDFQRIPGVSWNQSVEGYEPGDTATGWVTRVTRDGAFVSLDEGVEGLIPRSRLLDLREAPQRGAILRVTISRIDRDHRTIELTLLDREDA